MRLLWSEYRFLSFTCCPVFFSRYPFPFLPSRVTHFPVFPKVRIQIFMLHLLPGILSNFCFSQSFDFFFPNPLQAWSDLCSGRRFTLVIWWILSRHNVVLTVDWTLNITELTNTCRNITPGHFTSVLLQQPQEASLPSTANVCNLLMCRLHIACEVDGYKFSTAGVEENFFFLLRFPSACD